MEEMTIGQARDGFSAHIARLLDGSVSEYVIKNRSTPVARIVPIMPKAEAAKRPFGIASSCPFLADDDGFDALDAEIAEDFGL
jgi:antitoxin (DNA-binding transcriptional repressor) of toxin-antitoxin stability system